MKLLGISGTIVGSKTRIAVQEMLDYTKKIKPEVEIELMDLKNYDLEFCDGRDPSMYGDDTKKLVRTICEADYLIIGTPVFQGSFTGALKNVFDLLPPNALRHKVIGFIATGGTYQHYLVIENQLKPIAGYFRSYVAPSHVYLNESHYNENHEIVNQDVLTRMEDLSKELIFMHIQLRSDLSWHNFLLNIG